MNRKIILQSDYSDIISTTNVFKPNVEQGQKAETSISCFGSDNKINITLISNDEDDEVIHYYLDIEVETYRDVEHEKEEPHPVRQSLSMSLKARDLSFLSEAIKQLVDG